MTQTPYNRPTGPNPYRQLRRSQTDRKLAGVCGGVAEYLGVDPTVVRLAAVLLTIVTGGAGLLAYVLAMVVMPNTPQQVPIYNYPPRHDGPQDTP